MILYRSATGRARGINTDARQATFVAATERPVDTWDGPEVLRAAGVDLTRFARNPVFLDTHNTTEAGATIGSAKVTVQGRQLIAVVTYATTPRAEEIWTLVREGHLRGVSVGFSIRKFTRVREGEVVGEGESRVVGPARVVTDWQLIELSQAAVPADQDALIRRSYFQECDRMSQSIYGRATRPEDEEEEKPEDETPAEEPAEDEAPAEDDDEDDDEGEGRTVSVPKAKHKGSKAAWASIEGSDKLTPADVARIAHDEESWSWVLKKGRGVQNMTTQQETKEEASARKLVALRRGVMALAPTHLRAFAEGLILRNPNASIEAIRQLVCEESARALPPVGTPEAPEITRTEAAGAAATTKLEDVSDDVFIRSLGGA